MRELGFRSIVLPPSKAEVWLQQHRPKAIILSGGSASVHEDDCPVPPPGILEAKIPVLGICLGMQWIAQMLGGEVTSTFLQSKEYGPVFIETEPHVALFEGIDTCTLVWASHEDCVQKLPPGFRSIARSEDYHTMAAMVNEDGSIIGIQFHPEVHHTIDGKKMFLNFLSFAGCVCDWNPENVVAAIRQEVSDVVTIPGDGDTIVAKAILGLSGGVDSSVTAKLLQPVFGDNLLCVVIDTGFLRKGEIEEIRQSAHWCLGVNYVIIDAADRFFTALGKVTNPEKKRRIFKKVYQTILEEEAEKFGASFIIQGSLATDFIESGKAGESALIKSHHNIGIEWNLQEIHPLHRLFKYEVREIGRSLDLPVSITQRQPFPGPGLMVRVVGVPVTRETVAILRECDHRVREILDNHDVYEEISQLVVALCGAKTVGVKGDGRSYGYSIILRPVVTQDFMTCSVYHLKPEILTELMQAVTKHPQVTRLFLDVTTKPPGTTEME